MASKLSEEALTWRTTKGPVPVLISVAATREYLRARLGGPAAREKGVTAVEYALMVAIIALLLVGAFYTLFNNVRANYSSVADCLASGPVPGACAPAPPTTSGS
jgi:Flp pilus assembly pilin Flp